MSVSWLHILGPMVISAWLAAGCTSAKIDVGGTCILNSDCNGSLVCTMGKCHDACHTSADCLAGQSCVKTDDTTFCQLPAEALCSPELPCGGTFVCASDQHCRAPCQSRTACTSEQVCVSGVCAAPVELDPNNQLPQNGSGSAADGGTNACQVGPGGYCWSTYTNPTWGSPGPSASWVVPPSPEFVHVAAQSGVDTLAGMVAQIWGGAADVDLGQYDQLWFDADVPQSENFKVFVGQDMTAAASCGWNLSGIGKGRYTVDLKAANFCMPSNCGYDRSKSRFLFFSTKDWGVSNAIDITLTALGFSAVTGGFGPTTIGGSAGIGPGGWCAALFSWGTGTVAASWVGAPSTTQARVEVTDASPVGTAGLMIELPAGKQDLTEVSYIDVDANIALSQMSQFEVVLTSWYGSACHYHPAASAGTTTYSLSMASPTQCYTGQGHAFTPSSVVNITVGTLWDLTGNADITVTRIATR